MLGVRAVARDVAPSLGLTGAPLSKAGKKLNAVGVERATYAHAAKEMSQTAKKAAALGLASEDHAAGSAHGFRRAIEAAAREKTPTPIRKVMEARNIKKYGDPLGPSLETLAKTKTPAQIIEGAGKTNKLVNALGKTAEIGGAALELGGKAAAVAGVGAAGFQIGTGVDNIIEGKTAEGVTDIVSGGTTLSLDLAATAAVEAGTVGAGAVALAGLAVGGSVALATETVHAAIEGKETPLEVADKFYGTHFSDIKGWVSGDYRKR